MREALLTGLVVSFMVWAVIAPVFTAAPAGTKCTSLGLEPTNVIATTATAN